MSTRKACGTKGAGLCSACIKSLGTGSAVQVCGNGSSQCYEFSMSTADTDCVSWRTTDADDLSIGDELAGPGRLQPLLTVDPAVCNGLECNDSPDFFNPFFPGLGGGLFLPPARDVTVINEVALGGSSQGFDLSPIDITIANPSTCNSAALLLWYISESARFSQGIPAGVFSAVHQMRHDDNGDVFGGLTTGSSRNFEVTAGPYHQRQIRTGAIVRTVTTILPPFGQYRAQIAKNALTSLPVGISEPGATRLRGLLITGAS